MALTLSVSVVGAKGIIRRFRKSSRKIGTEVRKNIIMAASLIQAEAKKNFRPRERIRQENFLVGPKSLRIQTGQLRRSIRVRIKGVGADTVATIGPSVIYGATHEFGDPDRNIPARPYMGPALEETRDKVIAIIGRSFRPILD